MYAQIRRGTCDTDMYIQPVHVGAGQRHGHADVADEVEEDHHLGQKLQDDEARHPVHRVLAERGEDVAQARAVAQTAVDAAQPRLLRYVVAHQLPVRVGRDFDQSAVLNARLADPARHGQHRLAVHPRGVQYVLRHDHLVLPHQLRDLVVRVGLRVDREPEMRAHRHHIHLTLQNLLRFHIRALERRTRDLKWKV